MRNKTATTIFAAINLLALLPIVTPTQPPDIAPESHASYSAFGLPQNLGATINSTANDSAPSVSPNGLSLYFSANAQGTLGSSDVWVSQRPTLTSAWGAAQNLGAVINSDSNENQPNLSLDGRTMFFNSSRSGSSDIYVSTRLDASNDFGWTAAVNIGDVVNTESDEISATYYENLTNGATTLYFVSNRTGDQDIYQSTRNANGTFNAPTSVTALNSPELEHGPAIRSDGLEIFFGSERPGGFGLMDIWVSTRASVSAAWNPPVNAGIVNSPNVDHNPALSPDGSLYFDSDRNGGVGGQDLYAAARVSVNRSPSADFDGDSRSDISVFRPSDGTWHMLQSSTNTYSVRYFGLNGDKIVPGDYDGDGRTDTAVFRPSNGNWYVSRSSDGLVTTTNWGLGTDRPVSGDYDGDGRTDIAVYRNGTWYIIQSSNGSISYQQFGLSTDIPISSGS